MKNIIKLTLLTTAFVVPAVAFAEEDTKRPLDSLINIPGDFSGSLGVISDYTFRGLPQNRETPAIQGAYNYNHEDGFYLGVWGSSVDSTANDSSLEVDTYAGYTFSYEMFDFNVGGIYYIYPGVDSSYELDYYEYQTAITSDFDVASITGSVNYTPDMGGGAGEAFYYKGQLNIPLIAAFDLFDEPVKKVLGVVDSPFKNYGLLSKTYNFISEQFGAFAYLGRQTVQDNTTFGYSDYNDWGAGVTFPFQGFDFTVQYVDSSIRDSQCADGCDSKVLFSVTKSF